MGESYELITHRLSTLEMEVTRIGEVLVDLQKTNERFAESRRQTHARIDKLEE